jgi:hypothetical protein
MDSAKYALRLSTQLNRALAMLKVGVVVVLFGRLFVVVVVSLLILCVIHIALTIT